jgi:hypothetical protein
LLEDISTYKRDIEDLKNVKIKGRERKKEKERLDKAKGTEMRNEALSGMSSKISHSVMYKLVCQCNLALV